MYTDEYERLHCDYVAKMVEYHNAYLAYIHGKKSKAKNLEMRLILKDLKRLNEALIKESLNVKKKKIEAYEHKYNGQRVQGGDASRFHKNDMDTPKTDS
jgi:uncharacterized protein (DUF305 family)